MLIFNYKYFLIFNRKLFFGIEVIIGIIVKINIDVYKEWILLIFRNDNYYVDR